MDGGKSGAGYADGLHMSLSERMFYSIVNQPHPPRGADRRRSYRRPLGSAGTMTRIENGQFYGTLEVTVTDISAHGVGMRCVVGLELGTLHQLAIGAGGDAAPVTIEIVCSRDRGDGTFSIGAKYI